MIQQNQHMGDDLSSVTHTLESTQSVVNESYKKRSVLGHRYSAAVQAIQTVNPQKNSSMDRSQTNRATGSTKLGSDRFKGSQQASTNNSVKRYMSNLHLTK